MDVNEMERRFKAAIADLGLDADAATALGQQLVATEKEAAALGIAYKSEDDPTTTDPGPPAEITIGGVVYTVKAAPAEDVAEKADGDVAMESPMEDMAEPGEEPADMGDGEDVIGNMTPGEFWAQMQQYLGDLLAPQQKMADMLKAMGDMHGELKSMYTTKDDSRSAELVALKAQLAELTTKIATIEGDQPSTVLPDEVEAALKSAGPAAPAAPADPVLSDPTRPWAAVASQLIPEIYRQNGQS